MIRLRRPASRRVALLTLAAAVALPIWTLAAGTTHAIGLVSGRSSVRDPDGTGSRRAPANTDAGAVYPARARSSSRTSLSTASRPPCRSRWPCGTSTFPRIGSTRACLRIHARPQLGSDGYPARWGDPFMAFVGDVNGYEPDFTGYGVYYPPIVAAAERYGADRGRPHGWTIAEIDRELRQRKLGGGLADVGFQGARPAVLDRVGRTRIPWAIGEHAVPVIGYDPAATRHVCRRALWRGADHDPRRSRPR